MSKRSNENEWGDWGDGVGCPNATDANNSNKRLKEDSDGRADLTDGHTANSNTIPIFLKKTYRMIEMCDPGICSWTPDGAMFVVKNPELFASEIIPQYFDHNKFSSFARQLNFYGFRKVQSRGEVGDGTTAHVTFSNDRFRRGREDLLGTIKRSTRKGAAGGRVGQASIAENAREAETLRAAAAALELRVRNLEANYRGLGPRVEAEVRARVQAAVEDLTSSTAGPGGGGGMAADVPAPPLAHAAGLARMPGGQRHTPEGFAGLAGIAGMPLPGMWGDPMLGPQAARAFSGGSVGGGGGVVRGAKDAKAGLQWFEC